MRSFLSGVALFAFAGQSWAGGVAGTVAVWAIAAPLAAVLLYYASLPLMRAARSRAG